MATYYYTGSASSTGTSDTWSSWNATSSNATSSTDSNYVWYTWATDTSTSTCSTSSTWAQWITINSDKRSYHATYFTDQQDVIRRQREREESQRKYLEEQKKQEEERQLAEIKAHELLEDLIGKEQAEVYKETGRLLVKGKNSDYLLQRGGKVSKIAKDKVTDFCIHLKEKYVMPDTDNIISLMLLAKADEYKFDKIANVIRSHDKKDWTELKSACA